MPDEQTTANPDVAPAREVPRIVRRGWNPPLSGPWAWLTGRNVRRLLISLGAVALLLWFGWLVWAPLRHPRVQFVCVSGADYRVLRAPPLAFVAEDVAGLAAHGSLFADATGQTAPYVWDSLAEPAKFQSLGARLRGIAEYDSDQALILISAHGMIDAGETFLACRNFDPANPKAGRVSAADLIKQVRACSAGNKVVVLDVGRIDDDPKLGYIWNDLASHFAAEFRATGDESLWLLMVHGAGEQSHLSPALERSVFGYAMQWGLAGAADTNHDQLVTLDELHRYTAATVSDWVEYITAGKEQQHPMLVWGGEGLTDLASATTSAAAARVTLAPVAPDFAPEEMPTLTDLVRRARATSRGDAWYLAQNAAPEGQTKGASTPAAGADTKVKAASGAVTDSLSRINFGGVRSAGQLRSQAESGAREASRAGAQQAAESQADVKAKSAADATPNKTVDAPAAAPTAEIVAPESSTAPTTEATAAATSGGQPTAPAGTPATARTALPKLFGEAWQLRDAIAALPEEMRPSDYAPQSWREMEQALLDYELQYRAGRVGDVKRITDGLKKVIAGEKLLLAAAKDAALAPAATGPSQMLRFRSWGASRISGTHSAAMAQLAAGRASRVVDPAIDRVLQSGNAVVADQAGFQAHWAAEPASTQSLAEARSALTFGAAPTADWQVARLAWQTSQAAEALAAAAPWIVPWVGAQLDATDALRWEGERELLDAIGADHAARAQRLLEQSMAQYREAASTLETVALARRMERDLLARVPHYLRLQATISADARRTAAEHDAFVAFCQQLRQLSDLLITPDVARVNELRELTAGLKELQATLEQPLAADRIAALTSPPPQLGEPRQIAALLETPLPAADARVRLLSIAARLEGRLISDLKPVQSPDAYRPPIADPIAAAKRATDVAKLHWALTRLSSLDQLDGAQHESQVEASYMRLQNTAANIALQYPETIATFERQLEGFESALSDFYNSLPRRIADAAQANQDLSTASTRAERLIALRRVDRALRIVDARDARQTGDVAVSALIDAAEWQSLLAWHAERAARAANQASGDDAEFWSVVSADYRRQSAELLGGATPEGVGASPLVLEGDDTLDLSVEPHQLVTLQLRNRGDAPTDVWLVLHYDPAVVAIEPSGQFAWQLEQDLTASSHDPTNSATLRDANLLARAPSLRINPGQEIELRLQARSHSQAAQPARVIVRAVSRESVARHAVSLKLPSTDTVELAIDGVPGTATRGDDGWMLTPFPNRDNAFQFSLVNNATTPKEVKAEIFALSRPFSVPAPLGSLSSTEAAELRDRLGPLELLANVDKIPLPGGNVATPIPFPAPQEDAAAAPPLPRFDHGMLLSITDAANGRVSLHWLRSAPQRPRRYVHPRVRYNGIDERIEITVTAEDPAGMPDTPVRVACEVLESLSTGTQARLSDELRAPEFRAEMWIEAPLDPARVLTLALHVDDYPRAFLFRVPCQEAGRDIAPEDDVLAVRVKSPAAETAFRAPASAINVLAEIDLPRGAEDDPATAIEVGFDTDRDREFRGETTTRLVGDRQVENQLIQLAPAGHVVIHPRVSDFQLTLTPPGLVNNRVGVLGRILWSDRAAWSEPREILLDGAAPRIQRVRVKPAGVAAIGIPVEVTCLALDGDLSGVASVEMTIDQLGTAEFEGNPPPAPAKLSADRRWIAQLDTAPIGVGTFHVLVRATDKVGNVSDVDSSGSVRLMSPEVIAAELRRATNRVIGAVRYGKSGFGGITVRLEALPPDSAAAPAPAENLEPIAPVATDDQGAFAFDRVPPGKYKLIAEGVVRNKTRRAETELTVEPAPIAVRPLRLELR